MLASGSSSSDIVSLVTGLAWPVLVAIIFLLLLPSIRRTIASRGFTVKAGGMEITVQEASEQLATRLDDLRSRVIEIEDRHPGRDGASVATAPSPAAPEAPPEPAPSAAAPEIGRGDSARLRSILWVDDVPANNAFEIDALQRKGVQVASARSTNDAVRALEKGAGYDVIITDMGRRAEGRDAGLHLIRELKARGVTRPIIVYASVAAVARTRDEALQLGAYAATASATELMALLTTLGLDGVHRRATAASGRGHERARAPV